MRETADGTTNGALLAASQATTSQRHVPAIFIHAGAGFHSLQNEKFHLEACVAAAEMGMRFLRAGAVATEAVEAALRTLEDKEITNAGYGSNLSIDGTVECDATVVDHLGRSGACGAVPNIRNPIALAKLILDTSNQPLSLHRVPPNVLVGEGAREFAEEHGMSAVPNEKLVSRNARDRFLRWQKDLRRAETKQKEAKYRMFGGRTSVPLGGPDSSSADASRLFLGDHMAAIASGTWNEGQPDSPNMATSSTETPGPEINSTALDCCRNLSSSPPLIGNSARCDAAQSSKALALEAQSPEPEVDAPSRKRSRNKGLHYPGRKTAKGQESQPRQDGSSSPLTYVRVSDSNFEPLGSGQSLDPQDHWLNTCSTGDIVLGEMPPDSNTRDQVTDTIGAIAIDHHGNIAAGSSSGGIGMKHRGRLGPAALVGIGTAVVPCVEDDENRVSVAAVTSGTGEHMATTMASQRCAERLYYGNRKGPANTHLPEDDEDVIMESFVVDDFMNHAGVKNCPSVGAIGVMAVKKTRLGYYFYFAHNTDSFALASMGGNEKEPKCTMSRLTSNARIAKGGRKIRLQ